MTGARDRARMADVNERGWAPIHDAAAKGYVKSLQRYIDANRDLMELETRDDDRYTPIIIAATRGHIDIIKVLVNAGAILNVSPPSGGGLIELCIMKEKIAVLEYFIELNSPKLPAWKKIISFLQSSSDEECEATGKCLCILTEKAEHILSAFTNGVMPAIVKVLKSGCDDEVKLPSIKLFNNMLQGPQDVQEQFVSTGGIPTLVRLLKSDNVAVVQTSAVALQKLATVPEYCEQATQNMAVQTLIKAAQTLTDSDVLVEIFNALNIICAGKPSNQNVACNTPGCIQSIVGHYDQCNHKSLLLALTTLVSKLAQGFEHNQNAFIDEGISKSLVFLLRVKYRDLQLSSVDAILSLVHGNGRVAAVMIDEGVVTPLLQVLKKGRLGVLQERCACALWAIAGDDQERRREMANMIGVQYLIEFLGSLQESLHYVGSEGLGVLAQGPETKQSQIGSANGIHPLVRLLRSDKEHIVLSVIRTLQHLCVGVGYIPHKKNQMMLLQARGLKFLVALMVHSRDELVQVESAMALACATLGNAENLEDILKSIDFSYVRILRLLFSPDNLVRLLAGGALATFGYNSRSQQKEIAAQGGLRFHNFVPFLKSNDEYFRCNAAFQIVVLSRIIADEEQAVSSAIGIKLIVDVLEDSVSTGIQSLACDCIARLAHTRAGVPAAIVSIGSVALLCSLLYCDDGMVRGCAAIALGYLTYNHAAERDLLHRCRLDPYLMKALRFYVAEDKMADSFGDGWRHSKRIGLPPISNGRPCLVQQKSDKDFSGRPLTMMSLRDVPTSPNQFQRTSPGVAEEDDPEHGDLAEPQSMMTGRISEASDTTSSSTRSHTPSTPSSPRPLSQSTSMPNDDTTVEN